MSVCTLFIFSLSIGTEGFCNKTTDNLFYGCPLAQLQRSKICNIQLFNVNQNVRLHILYKWRKRDELVINVKNQSFHSFKQRMKVTYFQNDEIRFVNVPGSMKEFSVYQHKSQIVLFKCIQHMTMLNIMLESR